MPRPTRLHLPGVPQHITQRGNNRQACFYAEDDYRLYLELLQTACRNHDCLNTGLPTGNHRFRREIESALAIRLGHGKRGRPRKAAD